MRSIIVAIIALGVLAGPAAAGELDFDFGLQATTTGWPNDHGGGPILAGTFWFQPWIGATFLGKEHYATVDDRYLSYYSFNVAVRQPIERFRFVGALGAVHQHEESTAAIMEQPVQAVFGVGDGIRHRMGGRAGVSLGLPLSSYKNGDCYVALDLDTTIFAESERGPRWMASAGLSLGFTYDFARAAR